MKVIIIKKWIDQTVSVIGSKQKYYKAALKTN